MKQRVAAFLAAVVLLGSVSGCTTTSFAGLAKAGYVEEVDSASRATARDLEALQKQVSEIAAIAGRMQALASEMEQTQRTTAELQQLAKQVESRLTSLPRETLEMLVKSIEAYLAK